jgi:PKD repeat protein
MKKLGLKNTIVIISLFFATEIYSQALTASINISSIPCYGQNNGSAWVSVSGGLLPYTYFWSPSGETTETASALSHGTIIVKVKDAKGDTAIANTTLTEQGQISIITTSIGYCSPNSGTATVELYISPDPYIYLWSDGQTTRTATGLSNGNYTVTATKKNTSCSATSTVTISSFYAGISVTNDQTVCPGVYTGIVCNGGVSYLWSTGETTQSIYVIATSTTTYSVTVSKDTCSKLLQPTIKVSPFPISGFSASSGCFGMPVVFNNLTTSVDSIISIYWIFGDGTYSSDINPPPHTYPSAGTYYVSLYVKNKFYCQDSIEQKPIVVQSLPVADFTCNNLCFNDTAQLADNSTISSGNITQWSWNFGDPSTGGPSNTSNLKNPTHKFSSRDTFSIMLTVTSDGACQNSVAKPVLITGPSVGVAMKKDSINPLLWYMTTVTTGSGPFSYLWDFGDGKTSTLQFPKHTYDTAGHYSICLTITDINGCSVTSCDSTYKGMTPGIIKDLVVITPITGIDKYVLPAISIYPNPACDILHISFAKTINGVISIRDLTGRIVLQQTINTQEASLNVSKLSLGIYSLEISSGNDFNRSKVVIGK